jgi:hypothetical protein
MNLNNIFGISQRATGKIDENGYVQIDKIISFDIVGNPPFSNALFINERIQKELDRQELLKKRKEKLEKLNLQNE